MGRRARWMLATALALLPSFLGAARAQEALEPPRPRTGPNATQLPAPAYAEPQFGPPAASAQPSAFAPLESLPLYVRALRFTNVGAPGAIWRDVLHTAEVLTLEHRNGEPMDEAWVRRQFDAQGLVGSGAAVEADRLVALVQLINHAYLENGYVNSGLLIDPQNDEGADGVLSLTLIFGRVTSEDPGASPIVVNWGPSPEPERLETEPGRGAAHGLGGKYIRDRLPAAAAAPFNMFDLEREFRLLAEDPALRTVNASLAPGRVAGEAIANVRVDPQPRFDLYLTLANSRSPSVGGERAALGGSVRNVVFDGSVLSAEYGATEGLSDAVLSYSAPTFWPQLRLDARAETNDADVVEPALRPLNITSKSQSGELGLTYRLVDRPLMPGHSSGEWRSARSISLGARVGHKKSESFLLGMPFSFSPGSVDGVTETTVGRLTGDWIERDNENGRGRVWALATTATFGIEGTRSDVPGVPSPDENFTTVQVQANHARQIGAGFEVRARLVGQWASGLTYSSERFSVGGESTVRGYRENLILADEGAIGSVELSRGFSLTGGRRSANGDDWGALRASLFADAAYVHNKGGVAADPESISSVGVSLAWTPSRAIAARLTYGHALTDVPTQGDELADNGVHFSVTVRPLAWFDDW